MKPLVNFEKSLSELEKYLKMPIENDRDRAGIIQAFEFTFEQSWKSVQKLAAAQGVEVASPKTAFSFAMQSKWILTTDEHKWLKLISDRNLTTHTYHGELAQEILERIQNEYVSMFNSLLKSLQKNV
jgi:nucleotidyltransferase substrate binding protein (TIGR01987 family)